MTGTVNSWPALSFLEGLRPGPDESVELALLASYSADLGSIGAALLALAGKDNDAGCGSPSDFADAVERLRGRVRIVIQRGRLAKMRGTPRIAAVLDQFVREVDFDEVNHSWHPKAALVRTRNISGEIGWRLWIGSRNLTESINLDIGLLLISCARGGAPVLGADALACALAERAELNGLHPAALAATIAKVAWRSPTGVRVKQIRWSAGTENQSIAISLKNTDELVVVSPFIDKNFLARLSPRGAKPERRVLLTTMREIERIGPSLAVFDDLLTLDAPDFPIGDPELDPDTATAADVDPTNEEEEIGRGLHAKLLFIRSGRKRTLWLGSANATMRAWTGGNAEVTAELLVTEPIEYGLKVLLGSARLVEAPSTESSPDASTLEEEALEQARAQVAARWAAELNTDNEGIRLVHRSDLHPGGPHPDASEIALEVGALNGELVAWPVQQVTVHLGHFDLSERSEFVRLRVSRGEKGLSWLQRAPADPAFGQDRDRAAFVHRLGTRGFLLWLASLLADDNPRDEGDWPMDVPQNREGMATNQDLSSSLPTLEEMLAAWARAPEKFREIERMVSRYLPAVREQTKHEDQQTAAMLRLFDDLWSKLRIGLDITKTQA
ncbi:MAG: phospholipase D family protein [Bryobacterales bacterium]|nr:phospholipase D family protein [Bryobacterales bacterium]